MITLNYKERYKSLLKKNNITPQEVKEFNEAVKAYVHLNPNWKGETSKSNEQIMAS
tara:strand:+ start:20068 stop:20235 length:168 start_codon:yes stop_codon:yes gene_type:complete